MFAALAASLAPAAAEPTRRDAMRLAIGLGAGLVIGAHLPLASPAAAEDGKAALQFTPFVEIRPDSSVVVLSKHLDKGQGVATGLATLVAEELGADWAQIVPAHAPANAALYKNLAFGVQGTGGSSSIANSFEQYRKAGAAAGRPWWKAFRMRPETDLLTSARSFGAAECLVLDAFSDGYGGSGRTFDWSWIPPGLPARIVMSGGLDAGSVADAIGRIRPFAVDVSSGIQGDDPRTKDRSRMERFVAAVLEADARRP
ncbi:MAG TPA: molybdopterin-dependent oxidoreductase [Burkholderiaceae bacterium]|nr:molybdopterin-dependent oxidoreductase [Burkholderiaceae bacterium]